MNETASTGDAWIQRPKQALVTHISSTKLRPRVTLGIDSPKRPEGLRYSQRNSIHGSRLDLTAQTAPRDSDTINKTASTGDAWIRPPKQPLGTTISSMKLHPRVTLGFESPNKP
jgi:hypothetical protein